MPLTERKTTQSTPRLDDDEEMEDEFETDSEDETDGE